MSSDPTQVEENSAPLLASPREGTFFTCAAVDGQTGDLYGGTNHGVVVRRAATQKTSHVKLGGERILAATPGPDGVWLVGEEHLIHFESGEERSTKLVRRHFGIENRPLGSMLVVDGSLWLGFVDGVRGGHLARIEVKSKRVHYFDPARSTGWAAIRGLAVVGSRVAVLSDASLEWYLPGGEFESVDERFTSLVTAWAADASRSPATTSRADRLLACPFMRAIGGRLAIRHRNSLMLVDPRQRAALTPWPRELGLLASDLIRLGPDDDLVATPLGLLRAKEGRVWRVGPSPVVTLLEGERPLVVTRASISVVDASSLANASPFQVNLATQISAVANHAFDHGPPEVRLAALDALADGDGSQFEAVLLRALQDQSVVVRTQGCQWVGLKKLEAARELVAGLTRETNADLRIAAVLALVALGDTSHLDGLTATVAEMQLGDARALIQKIASSMGPAAVTALRPFVLEDRPSLRRNALLALRRLGFSPALLTSIALLERVSPVQRIQGLRALVEIEDPLAAFLLTAHAADPDGDVRRASLCALAQRCKAHPLPDLVRPALANTVQRHLGLSNVDLTTFDSLEQLLTAMDGTLPDSLVDRCLIHESASLRRLAIRTLARGRNRGRLGDLLTLLADPDGKVRLAVIEGLGELGDIRALRPLRELMGDPRVSLVESAGVPGYRHVIGAVARIVGAVVPQSMDQWPRDEWLKWYATTLEPMLRRFGVGP